jgi:hypothetical protein
MTGAQLDVYDVVAGGGALSLHIAPCSVGAKQVRYVVCDVMH